ncbi:MAG: chemotaxis protein CheB [Labilithrix sp.]|nr:chemotaxis protein CheB [Labilithrix sp.]
MSGVDVVVVGSSAGGLRALERILGALPRGFPVPIVAVQHRARESTGAYAEVLGRVTPLPVREIDDEEPLRAPGVFLGPPDYHVFLEPGYFALSVDEAVSFSRPSIDVLFESAADAYGAGVLAVLLTGANADGAAGLVRIKAAGGYAIVQDPDTAECREMPEAGIARAPVDRVLPLDAIAAEILRRVSS